MGLQDRDYMREPRDDEVDRSSSAAEGVEAFLSRLLQRHPRFFIYLGIGLVVVIFLGLLLAVFMRSTD